MTGSSVDSRNDAPSATLSRVGFIGMGSQGGPMARQIVDGGFATTLWARNQETLAPYADTAADYAPTPRELGSRSDLVCICVLDDAGVEEVIAGPDGVLSGMAPGGAIAIHSTIHPDTCHRMALRCAEAGVDLIDAPVSGGGHAAAERRLLVMTGGDERVVERFAPVFATYAKPIAHMGPLGAGQVTKLLNNTVFAAQLATAAGILAIGESLGVNAQRLAEVLSDGTGASVAMKVIGSTGSNLGNLSDTVGPLLRKDVAILAEVMKDRSTAGPIVWHAADVALAQLGSPRQAAPSTSAVPA